ncbi:MAG: light-harvesting protein [Sphingomonadales bacterium]
MINSRMWLVVNPTVGLPLFLGAVAVGSFSVHVAITTNTTWVNDFLSGREMGSTDAKMAAASTLDTAQAAEVVIDRTAAGEAESAVITLEDGRTAKAYFSEVKTASLQ